MLQRSLLVTTFMNSNRKGLNRGMVLTEGQITWQHSFHHRENNPTRSCRAGICKQGVLSLQSLQCYQHSLSLVLTHSMENKTYIFHVNNELFSSLSCDVKILILRFFCYRIMVIILCTQTIESFMCVQEVAHIKSGLL